jgi:hypothetical protein
MTISQTMQAIKGLQEKENSQLTALQNMANASELSIVIHEKIYQDKRVKTKKYFAQIKGKGTISPVLDYSNLNHFLLGMLNAKKILAF